MAVTLEVSYFNSFWLKRLKNFPGTTNGTTRDNGGDGYIEPNINEDWYIEESRIRGGFNNTTVDFGVKAYIVEEAPDQQNRGNSLIYSGVFNSRTGINNSNQFPTGEDITRSVDPVSGSIQKLYSENTNLIILQERKVNRALIDKDAVYTAEGQDVKTVSNVVIGAVQPFEGNFGISNDPGSFAVYGYNKYWTDKDRSVVLRLGASGIEEISNNGMIDWFRDNLSIINNSNGSIKGCYDIYNKNYTLSLQNGPLCTGISGVTEYTLAFDEISGGWVSFYSFIPEQMKSNVGNFYSWYEGKLWQHYQTNDHNYFYDTASPSTVQFIFNPDPTRIKTFKTVNYEGTNGWECVLVESDPTGPAAVPPGFTTRDTSNLIPSYDEGTYVDGGVQYRAGFSRKQNTYYASIKNNSNPRAGEVVFGGEKETGIKAFYATVIFRTDTSTDSSGRKELFSVGSSYINR